MTGSGTQSDPYIISSVTDLQNIENDLTAYYELGGNIDASATSGWNGNAGFVPITRFTGQLDGKGYTISDIHISRSGTDNQALLGQVFTSTAVVKNLAISGSVTGKNYVGGLIGWMDDGTVSDCSSSCTVTATDYCGGLIGLMDAGEVDDCYATGSVTGDDRVGGLIGHTLGSTCIIADCYATGAVSGDQDVGGLIGEFDHSSVTDCYATGVVTATGSNTGGLIGQSYHGSITRCYATGAVSSSGGADVGGLLGDLAGGFGSTVITNCYARGAVSGAYVGGLIGYLDDNVGSVSNCYSTGAVSGTNAGGLVGDAANQEPSASFWDTETSGQATSGGGTGKTTAQMKTLATFTDAGWDFTTPIWRLRDTVNNGYPSLSISGAAIFPSDTVARASSIRHIFRPGFFRMQIGLGDLGFDVDVAEATVRKALDTAKVVEDAPPSAVSGETYGIGEPTDITTTTGLTPQQIAALGRELADLRMGRTSLSITERRARMAQIERILAGQEPYE